MPAATLADRAQELLAELAGPAAGLRPEQAEAIDAVVGRRRRVLVVQRTGFGKSAIYFIATRMLRDAGEGPTLLVSPLLALMRDQVAAAERMGVRSETINSTNVDDWRSIEGRLAAGDIDLLCISPERLNNADFARRVLPRLAGDLGLLVVDEAHCISDWGHDFRPDYRRIRDAIANLAPGTPVVATTATANARVSADVAEQLGDDVLVLRGSLDRATLHLGVAALPSLAHRLAWLAQRIPAVQGTGIVYCLTVAQTAQTADFLRAQGIDAHAYSSDTPPEERAALEAAFKANELKALVATSALGMGVDKPDVAFVYHLGSPPSPIAYYQQVGRAGRSIDRAEAWLLPGSEDARIWQWFESVGLPDEPLVRRVLDALADQPLTVVQLERVVDLRRSRLETLLKILDVDGAVERTADGWARTGKPWHYDHERARRVRQARADEASAMRRYVEGRECHMRFLRHNLDDEAEARCGRCAQCSGQRDLVALDDGVVGAAAAFLRGIDIPLEPRRRWPQGLATPRGNIKPDRRAEEGRALARVDDAGWWPAVAVVLQSGAVDEAVVDGVVAALRRWPWARRPASVAWVPSPSGLTEALALRVAEIGRLQPLAVLVRTERRRHQADLQNAAHKCRNVWGALAVNTAALSGGRLPAGPVLLVDDVYDSGWTMTIAAALLREAGAEAVLPFALARR